MALKTLRSPSDGYLGLYKRGAHGSWGALDSGEMGMSDCKHANMVRSDVYEMVCDECWMTAGVLTMKMNQARIEELETENKTLLQERAGSVRYDVRGSVTEASIRAKLIEMGWTPPPEPKP